MPRNSIGQYSTTPGDNTDIGGINIAEGMLPSDVNNAMRELLSQLKEFQTGEGGDTISPPVLIATTATVGTLKATSTATFDSAVIMSSTLSVANTATVGVVQMADNNLIRPKLLDYAVKGSALGNTSTLATFDLETANFFSATSTGATTWAFSNPIASGDFCGFVAELANGGAHPQYWPAAVDWPGGAAPALTASGKDILVFVTRDAGTTWHGMAASIDSK
jgi:hypothetical protein